MSFGTVIIPKKLLFDTKALARAVENTLTGAAKDVKIDFDVTTRTWKERPKFTIRKQPGMRTISTDSDIYRFVARGTRVRYATMSDDFRPKTRVGWIGSNKGRGGMVFVDKRFPKPGIKARGWEKLIKKKWDKELPVIMQRAIDAEISK